MSDIFYGAGQEIMAIEVYGDGMAVKLAVERIRDSLEAIAKELDVEIVRFGGVKRIDPEEEVDGEIDLGTLSCENPPEPPANAAQIIKPEGPTP